MAVVSGAAPTAARQVLDLRSLALMLAFLACGSHCHQGRALFASGDDNFSRYGCVPRCREKSSAVKAKVINTPKRSLATLLLPSNWAAAYNSFGPPARFNAGHPTARETSTRAHPISSGRSVRCSSPIARLSSSLSMPYISRRNAAKALLLLPALIIQPHSASAGLFGGDPVPGKLSRLRQMQKQMYDLSDNLEKGKIRGDDLYDAQVVQRTLTAQFGETAELMGETNKDMTLLDPAELTNVRDLSKRFTEELENVRKGARRADKEKELAGTQAAGKVLEDYFIAAASKYKVPPPVEDETFEDREKFKARYYGFFSCEGWGLKRERGSNTCYDPPEVKEKVKDNLFLPKPIFGKDMLKGTSLKAKDVLPK